MEEEDKIVKKHLIDTIKNIKQKYQSLQQEENNLNEVMNFKYKPLLNPLNKIVESVGEKESSISNVENQYLKEVEAKVEDKAIVPLQKIKYISLSDFLTTIDSKEGDSNYGIKKLINGQYKIGRTEVKLNNQNIIVSKQSFKLTTGLMSLLFLKSPLYYTNGDLNNYKQIILLTGVHLNNQKKLKKDDSFKFKHIITPLFIGEEEEVMKVGGSLQTNYMELLLDTKIDYKYWDDINEIVDRLKLLYASQAAGHNGHNNEIIAIIEELKEANVII